MSRQYAGHTCPACQLTWLPPANTESPTCPHCGHNERRVIPPTSTPAAHQKPKETHEPTAKVSHRP